MPVGWKTLWINGDPPLWLDHVGGDLIVALDAATVHADAADVDFLGVLSEGLVISERVQSEVITALDVEFIPEVSDRVSGESAALTEHMDISAFFEEQDQGVFLGKEALSSLLLGGDRGALSDKEGRPEPEAIRQQEVIRVTILYLRPVVDHQESDHGVSGDSDGYRTTILVDTKTLMSLRSGQLEKIDKDAQTIQKATEVYAKAMAGESATSMREQSRTMISEHRGAEDATHS